VVDPQKVKIKICKYWQRGNCHKKSEECEFAHGEQELGMKKAAVPANTKGRKGKGGKEGKGKGGKEGKEKAAAGGKMKNRDRRSPGEGRKRSRSRSDSKGRARRSTSSKGRRSDSRSPPTTGGQASQSSQVLPIIIHLLSLSIASRQDLISKIAMPQTVTG
jgi:hypothetical protein